ncbi:MAG: lipid IV(A) 3-deoxy-D-manno-octulosonic acid transferase [Woeseiaceae bacterium]|nr:lipid IV(A) 3-deoxy-D-manno-octulosonic acid transferase [Woeseiaceae bacterium]
MRFLYNLTTYLLALPYLLYWGIRVLVNANYRPKIAQRFGFGFPRLDRCIWIHAVSVGEVVAAAPLVRALLRRYPHMQMLVTTVTPTGAARVNALFGDAVVHSYIPFEAPIAINRFFRDINPAIALIMETEIWPNLYRGCGVRNIPLVLVSARISPRSVHSYRRFLPLFRETLSHGIVIAAQSEADAERFLSLAANPRRTRVTGNIKYDIELPDDLAERGRELRRDTFNGRPVWVAASTHDGEESLVLDAHSALRREFSDLLLVLVPRHPERFSGVREQLERRGIAYVQRTSRRPCEGDTSVFLGDTMGEVVTFYAAADIAFVGGSLVPVGGHNLLEPAAVGIPIVTGPHVFNAQEIANHFIEQSACVLVQDSESLCEAIAELLRDRDRARRLGSNAKQILENNRGALGRLLELIEPLIDGQTY